MTSTKKSKGNLVLIFVENSFQNDENCRAYVTELAKDAGLTNYKFVNIFDSPKINQEDLPRYFKQVKLAVEKVKPTAVAFTGNTLLTVFGYEKKPAGITKYRGRVLTHEDLSIPVIPLESPFVSFRDRNREMFLACDLSTLKRVSEGTFKHQADMVIHDIKTPSDVKDLIKSAIKSGYCSYDFETSGLEKFGDDIVGTAAFCTHSDKDGVYHVWYYAEYEYLVPMFSNSELEELKEEFKNFFRCRDFCRIAWNHVFDDPFAEKWLGEKFPVSDYDGMYMEWCVKTKRPHTLKISTNLYLGYPEYDEFFDQKKKEVQARRGRVLTHKDDFLVLDFFGYEPEKIVKTTKAKYSKSGKLLKEGTEKVTYKWPKDVDKMKAAYLVVDPEVVREYNSLDAVYTLALFHKLMEIILEKDLVDSCELRHRIGEVFMRGEQHGLMLDVELNRKWNDELEVYKNQTEAKIRELVTPYLGEDDVASEFNPGSARDLAKVLYGNLGEIPAVDRKQLLKYFKNEDILKIVNKVEEDLFDDIDGIKEMLVKDEFSYFNAMEVLQEELTQAIFHEDHGIELPEYVNENYHFPIVKKPLGLSAMRLDPVALTATGQPSSSKASLLSLHARYTTKNEKKEVVPNERTDFIDLILMYKKCVKYQSTFVEKIYNSLDDKGMVRTAHNAVGTATGRASSSKSGKKGFNAQQMPSGFKRQIICPEDYYIYSLDIKQAEVYTLAAFSQDQYLIQALNEKDLHTFVASQIFKIPPEEVTKDQRSQGKTTLFLTVYGGGAAKLAAAFNIKKQEAQLIIDNFKRGFPDMDRWMESQRQIAHTAPYEVKTAFGTRISTRDVLSSDYGVVLHGERISGNAPIQGSAGEAMLYKLSNIQDRVTTEGWDVVWLVSVHDSATWMVHKSLINVVNSFDEKGKLVQQISGRFVEDLIYPEFNAPVPFPPLDQIKFKIDDECFHRWGGDDVDLKNFLTSEKPGDIFRYDLITDEVEEGEEVDELV